jgi:uncharacterized membrane protein
MDTFGKILVGIGVITVLVGLILWFFGDRLGWLGNLPGDIKIEGKNVRFYAPITTMIIISIVLSIVLSVIARFFK